MNRLEATYLGKAARLGCIICRARAESMGQEYDPPDASLQKTVIHHFRHGEGRCRAENMLAIPLCVGCHTGTHGIHNNRTWMKNLGLTENDLLAMTMELYFRTYGV
jgi:hypothetical protein